MNAKRIGIIGAGGWGTALACLLAQHPHRIVLWSHDLAAAEIMKFQRENITFLPGVAIPESIEIATTFEDLRGSDYLIISTPTQFIRGTLERAGAAFAAGSKVINVAKGIENGTLSRISEIVRDVWGIPADRYAALSGPSHAEEVGHGVPTAVVVASTNPELAREVQSLFMSPTFRVYSSTDVIGVELCGALKNVIAVSAGICDGAGFGDNTKASLLTRGLAEMTRMGLALGAQTKTFAGLSGLGDLIVTCNSRHSRNRFVGEQIGRGRTLDAVLAEMKMVAEGVATTKSAYLLAQRTGVDMPIVNAVHQILFEGKDSREATRLLMTRDMKEE